MAELETGAAEAAVPTTDVVSALAQEAPTAAPESPAEPQEQSLDDILSKAYDKATSEPERGPDGKFVSKNSEAVEPESEAPADAKAEDQTSPEAETVEPAKPAIDPPASWSREMRDKWAALPPEAQEYISRRESEAHSQISRLGQQVKSFEPVARTLEQYRPVFERNGMSFDQGVNALLAAQQMLDADPRTAILEIARTYGVDLGASEPANDSGPSRESIALRAEIAELKRQIAETRTDVRSSKAREEEARLSALQSEVEAFAKAKPFFSEVQEEVAFAIPILRQRNPEWSERQLLETAYDKAVRLNDAVWTKIEGERKAKEAAEAKKKAEDAKKVASINVKSGTQARPAAKTIDDDLSAVYDRIHSRAS